MVPTLMMMVTTCGAQLHLFTSEMFWFPRLPNPGPISDNVPGVVGTTGQCARCCPLPRPAEILTPQHAAATIAQLPPPPYIHRTYSRVSASLILTDQRCDPWSWQIVGIKCHKWGRCVQSRGGVMADRAGTLNIYLKLGLVALRNKNHALLLQFLMFWEHLQSRHGTL